MPCFFKRLIHLRLKYTYEQKVTIKQTFKYPVAHIEERNTTKQKFLWMFYFMRILIKKITILIYIFFLALDDKSIYMIV